MKRTLLALAVFTVGAFFGSSWIGPMLITLHLPPPTLKTKR